MRRSIGTVGSVVVALFPLMMMVVTRTSWAMPPAVAGPIEIVSAGMPEPPAESAETPIAPGEDRPLGIPNGVFSARPAAAAGTAAAGVDAVDTPPRSWSRWLELARVVGALTLVIGLIAVTRWFLKRASGGLAGAARPSGILEILARYPVARGQSLVLLKLDRRVLLLHQTGATMTTLSEMTDANEVGRLLGKLEAGARTRDATRFRSLLQSFEDDHDQRQDATPLRLERPDAVEVIDLTRPRSRGNRRRLTA
ncbi:MAG: flagellar biosynthetic protein FliO [Phycisphaerales bacterium]|nr:flagellar biosynthetic protein FliO [Phycisphaerales bacterium]